MSAPAVPATTPVAHNEVSTLRHDDVFDAGVFNPARIDVIGVGATGSKIALELAKLGVTNLHIWDDDVVEGHNIANQAFRLKDIGRKKVEALAEIIKDATGLDVVSHDVRVEGGERLGKYVFLLVDTMSARKAIWAGSLKMKLHVERVFETRMDADEGQIYVIDPRRPAHISRWEDTLFNDGEAATTTTACGASVTVGATSSLIAGHATWAFIQTIANGTKPDKHKAPENFAIYGCRTAAAYGEIYAIV